MPERETSGTTSNVTASDTAVTLLSASVGRRFWTVYNDADKVLYLKFGTGASTTSFTVKINPQGYFESPVPVYIGDLTGIWATSPTGAARITEKP